MTPRGRHAPPIEERHRVQLARMFAAGREIWEESGLRDLSIEGLARQAGMSKATVYDHFACIAEFVEALVNDELARLRSLCDPAREDGRVLVALLAASLLAGGGDGSGRSGWARPVLDGPMLDTAQALIAALAGEGYEIVRRST